jgi:hypothetical protein
MPSDNRPPGRLIALEAESVRSLAAGTKLALRSLKNQGAVSRWDSSNTFFELGMAIRKLPSPSPRTLLLLYASDLAFRLHWEIKPALEEGRVVLAAPYIQTAVALGMALGLARSWLEELFSFAPAPAAAFRAREQKKRPGKSRGGFVEFCYGVLGTAGQPLVSDEIGRELAAGLQSLAPLTKPALKKLRPKK